MPGQRRRGRDLRLELPGLGRVDGGLDAAVDVALDLLLKAAVEIAVPAGGVAVSSLVQIVRGRGDRRVRFVRGRAWGCGRGRRGEESRYMVEPPESTMLRYSPRRVSIGHEEMLSSISTCQKFKGNE